MIVFVMLLLSTFFKEIYSYILSLFLSSLSTTPPCTWVNNLDTLGSPRSSDATWTAHINATCLKARGLIGMLYRKLYSYTDTQSLLKLYWATPGVCQLGLGSPCTQEGGIEAIECVEKFVLKVCLRDSSHSTLASSLRRHNN